MEGESKALIAGLKVYCPRCGKSLFKNLNGVVSNDCPRCRTSLTIVVNGKDLSVFGSVIDSDTLG